MTEALAMQIESLRKLKTKARQTLHFDLSLTGFDGKEIDELLAPRADEQTLESVPEKPQVPVSVPGDLWLRRKPLPLAAYWGRPCQS